MSNRNSICNLWKLTDGNGRLLKHYKDQYTAAVYLDHETRNKRPAKLYCCTEEKGKSDDEQDWLLFEYNCDPQTGEFIEQ
jgi:hypothetical protein